MAARPLPSCAPAHRRSSGQTGFNAGPEPSGAAISSRRRPLARGLRVSPPDLEEQAPGSGSATDARVGRSDTHLPDGPTKTICIRARGPRSANVPPMRAVVRSEDTKRGNVESPGRSAPESLPDLPSPCCGGVPPVLLAQVRGYRPRALARRRLRHSRRTGRPR
jgi:hypothetical protein